MSQTCVDKSKAVIEYIPPKVNLKKDLFPGLDEKKIAAIEDEIEHPTDPEVIKYIKTRLHGHKYNRYPKWLFGCQNGLIYGLDGLYGIPNEDGKQTEAASPGSFGHIKDVMNFRTNKWYILKTQIIDNPRANFMENFARDKCIHNEHQILTKLNLTTEPLMIRKSIKCHRTKANILMKHLKGMDLFQLFSERNDPNSRMHQWPNLFWLHVSIRVAEALYLKVHKYSVLHCDIKLENLLYDIANDEAHIIDFGSAKETTTNDSVRLDYLCIPDYNAPENFNQSYTEKSEVFAFSNILEALLCNNITSSYISDPSQQPKPPDIYLQSTYTVYDGRETIFSRDGEVIHFLKRMRSPKQDDRPSMEEVVTFLKKTFELYTENSLYTESALRIKTIINEEHARELTRIETANNAIKKQQKSASLLGCHGLFNRLIMQNYGLVFGKQSEPIVPHHRTNISVKKSMNE